MLPDLTTPMTELEAVNLMLQATGEAPVNTLDSPFVESTQALSRLRNTMRYVLTTGYWFNTERDYPLPLDINSEIFVPANALSVQLEPVGGYRGKSPNKNQNIEISQRGTQLYDSQNHTFIFSDSIVVKIVWLLLFEDMPGSARNYVAARACREFLDSSNVSDAEKLRLAQSDEAQAKKEFDREHRKQNKDKSNIFANAPASGILARPGLYSRVI